MDSETAVARVLIAAALPPVDSAAVAAFDDPSVTELRAYNIGDGGDMPGLLLAGRRDNGGTTRLVFLLD